MDLPTEPPPPGALDAWNWARDQAECLLAECLTVADASAAGLTICTGPRFRIRLRLLAPGARLARHRHLHRTEFWCAVQGTGLARIGEETLLIAEGSCLTSERAVPHEIENPGRIALLLVEIQTGICMPEDVEFITEHSPPAAAHGKCARP